MTLRWLRPIHLALLATVFDGAWAVQALSVTRVDAVSNVELVSLIIWCFFHLPAALVCSAVLKPMGWLPADPHQMPDAALLLFGAMGLAQTFALVFGLWSWWRSRRPALRP